MLHEYLQLLCLHSLGICESTPHLHRSLHHIQKKSKISCIYCKVLKMQVGASRCFHCEIPFSGCSPEAILTRTAEDFLGITWGCDPDIPQIWMQTEYKWVMHTRTDWMFLCITSTKVILWWVLLFAHMLSCPTARFKNRHFIGLLVESRVENWPTPLECWPGHKIDSQRTWWKLYVFTC